MRPKTRSACCRFCLVRKSRIAEREAVFILGNGKDSAIAVCTGKWKLIVRYGSDSEQRP